MTVHKIDDPTTQEIEEVIEQLRTAVSDIAGYVSANDAANTLQPSEEANLVEVVHNISKQIGALSMSLMNPTLKPEELALLIKTSKYSVARVADYLDH